MREKIGPVAAFKLAITVARLPKTRSGKILRGTIKKIADGDPWTMPATIDDPAILDEIGSALKEKGWGVSSANAEKIYAERQLRGIEFDDQSSAYSSGSMAFSNRKRSSPLLLFNEIAKRTRPCLDVLA